jgi:ketosteroid isomerase-like protein
MNGDSNGSFWYRQEATVKAITNNQVAGNRFDFNPRYIEVDVLEKGKYAVAYYYLVGTYTINGVTKSDYRTRVCQVLVKEGKKWKVKSGSFTPLHSGSGIPD